MSVLDTLKGATKARRSVTLCLDAALVADWEAARERLAEAAAADERAQSLAFENVSREVDEMDSIRERMLASEVTFLFEQMTWPARLALQAEHPPREKNIVDAVRGYNMETYIPAVIRETCISVTGADGDEATEIPDDVWDGLLANLNYEQMDRLSHAAMSVNDSETQIPTSARSLLGSQDSRASLAQPSPGTSPQSDFKGGSRPTSPRSSTAKKAAAKKVASSA